MADVISYSTGRVISWFYVTSSFMRCTHNLNTGHYFGLL